MKLIIAEKPSVERSIAHALGVTERYPNKYDIEVYKNDEYIIASALGHLYGFGMPQDYGYAADNWVLAELPMFPDLAVKPIMADEARYNKQRNLLRDLMNSPAVTEIICATDAGREGELIFRHIYTAIDCQTPVSRLWVSSLTEEAILKAVDKLSPADKYDNLYAAGLARAKADWYFGMNTSRLYSIKDDCNHRLGRVKIPVLVMVTKRDSDIKNFVKRLYYKVFLDGAEYEGEFDDKEKAELLAASIRGKVVTVASVSEEEKTEQRPPLFSLTGLQREANEKLGYTAADTLKYAQSLYEKKLITYPRTDSKHLTDDMKASLPDLVHSFSESDWFAEHVEVLEKQGLTLDKRIIDNNKVSDHHAIIPTMQAHSATSLSAEENKLLNLIVHRLLAALDKPYTYTDTEYIFDCSDYKFKLKTKTPIEPGFMRFEEKPPQKPKVMYEQGDRFTAGEVIVKDGKSEPPKHYTDSTLLSSMENIDNIFETAELKEYVKGKGLGTPATRAAIIEELISAKYITRQGKNILATDFGAEFADSLPPKLKNPERTAEWEKWLAEIEEGKTAPDMLLDDVCGFVRKLVEFETTNERPKLQNAVRNQKARESLGACPRCGKNIYENTKAGNFYCESGRLDEGGCGFTLWAADRIFTDKLTAAKVKALLSGKSIPRSAKNKDNVVYSADYRISETEKEKFGERYVNLERVKATQTEKTELGKCPKCGKAVYEGKLNFYCTSASREHKCFTLWKESNKLSFPVTAKMCSDVLKGGKIKVAQKDLEQNSFSAEYELGEYNGSYYLRKV